MNGERPKVRGLRPADGQGSGADLIYRSVLDNVASGVVSLDTSGVITSINAAGLEILGLKGDTAVGRTFTEIFAQMEGTDAFADTILDAVYESSAVDRVVEATFAAKTRTLSVATRYLREERDGRMTRLGVVAVFTDISEIRELRETELRLAKELETRHSELLDAYRELEDTNRRLGEASKRMNVVRVGAGIGVLALFVAVGLHFWDAGTRFGPLGGDAAVAAAPAEFASLAIEPRPVSSSITLLGHLAPLREVEVTSPIKGKVAAVHVRAGERVSEGRLLVEMDVAEAEIERREAQVTLLKARDRVAELENWSAHVDVSKARRAVSKSTIALETAKNRIAQTGFLLDRGIIPASEHEAAEREHRNRLLDLQSAEQDLRAILGKGAAELDVARLELDNARARLGTVERTLREAAVTAPAAGVVMRAGAGVGDAAGSGDLGDELKRGASVDQGDRLLTIGDLQGVTVVGHADEVDVTRLRPGQAARIAGDAFPGVELRGTVVRVSSQAMASDDRRRAPRFEVAAAVDTLTVEQRRSLRLGMSATLEVVVYEKDDALLVPIHAVHTGAGRARLRVRNRGTGEVRLVEVTTGITTLDSVEIVDGIAAGDEILVRPR